MDNCFQRLLKNPEQFDFYQAIRLLHTGMMKQGLSEVGSANHPDQELIRFFTQASLSFPTTRVEKFLPNSDDKMSMIVSLFGLTGPSGVLPDHYKELLLQRRQFKDTALHDFLDLFNHRTLSLLYRAWEKYRPYLRHERYSSAPKTKDPLAQVLASLVGLNLSSQKNVYEKRLIYHAHHFMQLSRSAFTLENFLSHYFQLPIQVKQFQGSWLYLDEIDRNYLGYQGSKSQLGVNTILGNRVWDLGAKFRLLMGPLSLRQFTQLEAGGELRKSLKKVTRFYAGPFFNFDLKLLLNAEDIPYCIVASKSEQRLGWDTWLKSRNCQNSNKGIVIIH